jgi:hypothetical protein
MISADLSGKSSPPMPLIFPRLNIDPPTPYDHIGMRKSDVEHLTNTNRVMNSFG